MNPFKSGKKPHGHSTQLYIFTFFATICMCLWEVGSWKTRVLQRGRHQLGWFDGRENLQKYQQKEKESRPETSNRRNSLYPPGRRTKRVKLPPGPGLLGPWLRGRQQQSQSKVKLQQKLCKLGRNACLPRKPSQAPGNFLRIEKGMEGQVYQ